MTSSESLAKSSNQELEKIGRRLANALRDNPEIGPDQIREIELARHDIEARVEHISSEIEKLIRRELNALLAQNRAFLNELAEEIAALDVDEDDGSEDDELADEHSEEPEERVNLRRVSAREATRLFEAAIRGLARARSAGKKVGSRSRNGRILEWLGDRVPSPETIKELGKFYGWRASLAQFRNPRAILVQPRRLSALYRRFRTENLDRGRWYKGRPKASEIAPHEVDLILLTLFRNAGNIFRSFPDTADREQGILSIIGGEYRNQILVDEAVDFSPLQLATMRELSAPQIGSFFMCGDLNQRITEWGIRDHEDLAWVAPELALHKVTVSYRQSRLLIELAKDIALIGGSDPVDIALPDRVDAEGVPPVLLEETSDLEMVTDWLADRVAELESQVMTLPPIAVLVNNEADVIPVAQALSARLEEHNLQAVPCSHGQLNGTGNDVRVFDIRHIKGLEFEAVFFIAVDELVRQRPELFAKFLYVGATRAATYLGLTSKGPLPVELEPLRHHFSQEWT